MMTVDQLVDAFVVKVNASAREPAWPDGVPPSLRLGLADKFGLYDWRIQPQEGIDWVDPVECHLPAELPPSFRSLAMRYVFPAFRVGGLWLLANTREQTLDEWRTALWRDKALSSALLREGYVQFARPAGGSYDPICFDTARREKHGECPLVWVDHEDVLCNDKVKVYMEVAPSFVDFVQDYLAGETS